MDGAGNGCVVFNLRCLNKYVCNNCSYTNLIDSLRNKICKFLQISVFYLGVTHYKSKYLKKTSLILNDKKQNI